MLGRRGAIVLACAAALVMSAAAHADAFGQLFTTTAQAAPTSTAAATQTPSATTPTPASHADPHPAAAIADEAILVAASTAHNGADVPVALVLVGALVLIALALWGLARWWAWEPPWLVRWRHSTAEAGWRASAAWAEFIDWLRLGR